MARSDQQTDLMWRFYRELVERAWNDPAFAERLRSDLEGTLQEEMKRAGLESSLPPQVNLIEDTNSVMNFTIPSKDGFC